MSAISTSNAYRSAILGAFDKRTICEIKDINEHLKETDQFKSYQSSRRMLTTMAREGLITEMEKRGPRNQVYYTKLLFPNHLVLLNRKGSSVGLNEFTRELISMSEHPILNARALNYMRDWMLFSIGAAEPDVYKGIKITPPVAEDYKSRLKNLLTATELLHSFIKTFLDSNIWTNPGQAQILKELEGTGIFTVIADIYRERQSETDS